MSPRAKRIRWIAILCTVPVWMIPPVGVPLTIIVWIIMNKTVIKKDLAEHEAENNANVENYLKEHVAPLEAREQELTDKIEALHTSGKLDWARDIVGAELFNAQSIGEIYDLLKNRRADNLKEALNLYDDNQHKARMEASQAAIQNATEVAGSRICKTDCLCERNRKEFTPGGHCGKSFGISYKTGRSEYPQIQIGADKWYVQNAKIITAR